MDSLVRVRSEVKAFWTPRWRRNLLIGCTVLAIGGYGTYRVYRSTLVAQKCRQIQSLLNTLSNIAEAAEEGSNFSKLVCADLHAFIISDTDEVPQSLRQLLKLGRSDDVRETLMTMTAAFSHGILTTAMQYGSSSDGRKFRVCTADSGSSIAGGRQYVGGVGDTVSHLQRIQELHFVKSQRDSGSTYKRSRIGDRSLKLVDELPDNLDEPNGADDRVEQWHVRCECSSPNASYGSESLDGRLPERLLGKIFSPAGTGFASAVVGSATRNFIMSIIEFTHKTRIRRKRPISPLSPSCRFDTSTEATSDGEDGELDQIWSPLVRSVLDFSCSSKGKPLISECIETFVATAVTAYLEKTKDVNMYEDLVAGLTRPEHQGPVKDMFTSVCSTAVQTLVRTSHEVFSVGSSGPSETDQSPFDSDREPLDEIFLLENTSMSSKSDRCKQSFLQDLSSPKKSEILDQSTYWQRAETRKGVPKQVHGTHGLVAGLSRTLAIPSNRKLVVEVAGIMSAEAMRSLCHAVIGVCCSLLSGNGESFAGSSHQQFTSLVRNSLGAKLQVFEQRVDRLARVAAARSLVVMTVFLAICLHCMLGVSG